VRRPLAISLALAAGAAAAQAPTDPTASRDAARELDQVVVVGRAQTLYSTPSSSFATRTDTALEDTPQSIQVINRDLIDDQAARQITDLYRNVAGVSAFSYAGVTFRGFRQEEILYDGLRGDPYNGFAVPQLFSIAQVEFLKGPSGALYGAGQPGGLINYVTRKPSPDTSRELRVGIGNYDYWAAGFDATGSFDAAQRFFYRVGLYRDDEQPFRRNTALDNRLLDLGLGFAWSTDGQLILQLHDIEQHYGGARLRGVPVTNDGQFLASRRWNHNEASDFQDLSAEVAQLRLEQRIHDRWRLDATLRHYDNTELQQYHEPFGLRDTDGDGVVDYSLRQFRDQERDNSALAGAFNAVGELAGFGGEHTLLLGADFADSDGYLSSRLAAPLESRGRVPGLSLRNPVYGLTSPANYALDTITPSLSDSTQERIGLYLQDQLRVNERLDLLLGARHDRFEDVNHRNGQRFDDGGWSLRGGAVWHVTAELNGYVAVGEGFVPQALGSQNPLAGGPFDPETSELREVGLKSVIDDGRWRINGALYEIERTNVLQADPRGDVGNDGVNDQALIGRVRARGVEIDLIGDLSERWVINAAYAYNDTRILEATSAISNAVGDRFANAPKHTLGVWTRYAFPTIDSALAVGLDYVDRQLSLSGQTVKPFTVYDLSWQTQLGEVLLQLNVKNLTDKVYAVSGFTDRTGSFPGEPRRVYLQAMWRF
jgi:iron complex outermembrane recepter protein